MTPMIKRMLMGGLLLAAVALAGAGPIATVATAQEPTRIITNIAGDLYRLQNNFHYSVFLVTSEGIIATDPINADAARWLEAELAERFNQPVRYLIYSHDHADHIAGGEVFADTAVVVAHESAQADIIAEKRPTAVPDITFNDQLTIELGGQVVELSYLGRGHSDNMIVMRFPAERVLFAVDFIPIKALAFRDLSDGYIPEWMEAIKRTEAMDYDILVPGHGPIGAKADAAAFRGYMEALYTEVLAAARAGQSLEEMQRSITMDAYKEWFGHEDWRALNIEGMHNHIALHRRGN